MKWLSRHVFTVLAGGNLLNALICGTRGDLIGSYFWVLMGMLNIVLQCMKWMRDDLVERMEQLDNTSRPAVEDFRTYREPETSKKVIIDL